MTIKYEPVFGDQSLFDGADPDVFIVETNGVYKTFHKETKGKVTIWTKNGCDLAMRRIIKTPTWTRADQEAGVLPPVGAKCLFVNADDLTPPENVIYPEIGTEIEIVGVSTTSDGAYPVSVFKWLHEDGVSQRYASSGYCSDFAPIETPEEKAARLKDEWLLHAAGFCQPGKIFEGIYNALLSGELKAPAND